MLLAAHNVSEMSITVHGNKKKNIWTSYFKIKFTLQDQLYYTLKLIFQEFLNAHLSHMGMSNVQEMIMGMEWAILPLNSLGI